MKAAEPARALFAIPISDPGLGLHRLVRDHTYEFDESGGAVLWWLPIGPPDAAGPVYKALRSAALVERDRIQTEEYWRRCQDAGGEDNYLRGAYLQLAKQSNVPYEQRPVIVFETDPLGASRVVLPIAPAAFEDGDRRRQLACLLHQGLREDRVKKFAQDGEFTPRSITELQAYANHMSSTIAKSIARGRGVSEKMWNSYSVAVGLVERPDPKVCTTGEVEVTIKGALTLRTFTNGTLDDEVTFAGLNPVGAKQRQLMLMLVNAWPHGVPLRNIVEEVYGDEVRGRVDDAAGLRMIQKSVAQLFRDIRHKKLEPKHLNPDILPLLSSPACARGRVALRLAKLTRHGLGHRD